MNKVKLNKKVSIQFETPKNQSFKFGYYNYNPISNDGSKMLAHKISFEGRLPNEKDIVEIGFFELETNSWIPLCKSKAFNWQQGSMLQWLGPDFNTKIIFNDYDDEGYFSRIINVNSKEEKKICKPIYAVHPSGKFSISLNFERCNFTRAYSYSQKVDLKWENISPKKDGILKINFQNNTFEEILNLNQIINYKDNPNLNVKYWIEHIMFNKSSTRFAFYNRSETPNGFYTRVFTSDNNGENLWNLPLKETESISHLGWKNDSEFTVFVTPQSKLQTLWIGKPKEKIKDDFLRKFYRKYIKNLVPFSLKKIIAKDAVSYYKMVIDKSDKQSKINISPSGMDGHPSFSNSGRYMLTDTYADKNNYRYLLLHDFKKNKTIQLGSFYSYYNNCNWRADLHPRLSNDQKKVIIDFNTDGKTRIMVLNVEFLKLY